MDDKEIVDLYWARSERAIDETANKYGGMCYHVAYHILNNSQDAEESVSDTYFAAWNRLPPHRPSVLSAFLSKITRFISIDRWRASRTAKRGGGELLLALEELEGCVSGTGNAESDFLRKETIAAFNRFLDTLPDTDRRVFLRRYFALEPIRDIAGDYGFSESKVKSMLHRTRAKLRAALNQEGLL